MKKLSLLFVATILLISCSKEETHKKHLTGLWKVDDTWCVEIKKDRGYFVLLNAEAQFPGLSKFLKIGDMTFKDLKKTGDNRWSGKEICWYYYVDTGEILQTDWDPVTIVLSGDKKSFISIRGGSDQLTYYKVNNVLDNVPDQTDYYQPYYEMFAPIPQSANVKNNMENLKKGKIGHSFN